jgi:hypothetical protein
MGSAGLHPDPDDFSARWPSWERLERLRKLQAQGGVPAVIEELKREQDDSKFQGVFSF